MFVISNSYQAPKLKSEFPKKGAMWYFSYLYNLLMSVIPETVKLPKQPIESGKYGAQKSNFQKFTNTV